MKRKAALKLIIGIVAFLAAIFLSQFLYYVNIYFEKKANHEKVVSLISEDLLFSWDTLDDELESINNLIDSKQFFNEDKGRLYERASLIYMQKGETMAYYRYLGYALYYLERSDDKDYTVNIYLDLANFFLNNYTGDSAKNMIEHAQRVEAFDDIEDLQIRSYAFRMLGMVAITDEDYSSAEKYLLKSQELIDMSNTGVFEEAYTAINDAWLARVYVETGRFDECQEKLDKWEGHKMFTTDVYRQIMLRDLIVPYYQAKCYLSAGQIFNDTSEKSAGKSEEKELEVAGFLDEFMKLCEENGYEKAELSTLLKIQKDYPPTSETVKETLMPILNRLYTKLFNYQNIAYANVIDATVTDSKAEMAKNELLDRQVVRRTQIILFSILVVAVIIIILVIILLNSRFDELTGLFNRRIFNYALARAKKKKALYGVVMIDIDDFKQINDTYGHQNGDIVLWRLGQLMQKETTPDVHCYRYGGEEFVILLDQKAVPYAERLAERLRHTMEQQGWEFGENTVVTLSLGVATGKGDTDVLKQADDNLYKAKEIGKNMVILS
ncbi:GGDEF domain-containing protein [Butyrivibrio sp. VCD2006]|uniref:GGDEF domain-containing protein n=1 Tax=Butyrivibrio sp. VCD2006 TaxID=1280664 RepID=UPI000688AC5D|nr:GGDEF domain-containing protein [Butyrivibrio sp. VCD2006]